MVFSYEQVHEGYPLKAGHSVASITYHREDLMTLTRPW